MCCLSWSFPFGAIIPALSSDTAIFYRGWSNLVVSYSIDFCIWNDIIIMFCRKLRPKGRFVLPQNIEPSAQLGSFTAKDVSKLTFISHPLNKGSICAYYVGTNTAFIVSREDPMACKRCRGTRAILVRCSYCWGSGQSGTCPSCRGDGGVPAGKGKFKTCPYCKGSKKDMCWHCFGRRQVEILCPDCS